MSRKPTPLRCNLAVYPTDRTWEKPGLWFEGASAWDDEPRGLRAEKGGETVRRLDRVVDVNFTGVGVRVRGIRYEGGDRTPAVESWLWTRLSREQLGEVL